MKTIQVEVIERKEIALIGYSIVDSLNNVMESKIVGKLREELANKKHEVTNRKGDGIYLVQVYPKTKWSPDAPFQHVVGMEVTSIGEIPNGMSQYMVPAGRYAKIIHNGPESSIANTYDFVNERYAPREFDFEYWHDINSLEDANSQIEIYVPIKE